MSLPSDNPVLDVRALSCDADRRILDEVGFAVGEGEMIAVLGPAGSGKSVLKDCLVGDREPSGGAVWVNGTMMRGLSRRRRRELFASRCGVVHQKTAFLPELTVAENVALPLLVAGLGSGRAAQRASAWIDRFEISDHADEMARRLPLPIARRAALARAFVNDPVLLLADEAFASLPGSETAAAGRIVRSAAASHGTAVVLFTRSVEVAAMCGRTVHLDDGRTRAEPVPCAPIGPLRADESPPKHGVNPGSNR